MGLDPQVEQILRLFDERRSERLDLRALLEHGGGQHPGDDPRRVSLVARMVDEGLLRAGEGEDSYRRTEDGRLAVAAPLDVTLYTRQGCHLCEEVKAQMAPLLREFGARLREVDIDGDVVLRERWTDDVPVIFLGPRKVAKHRVDLLQLRRQLGRARSG